MKIVIGEMVCLISWKHVNNHEGKNAILGKRSYTECYIDLVTSTGTSPFLQGVADCSPRDNFNKATGRKISFGRAVADLPDKNTRRRFWEVYLHLTSKINSTESVK